MVRDGACNEPPNERVSIVVKRVGRIVIRHLNEILEPLLCEQADCVWAALASRAHPSHRPVSSRLLDDPASPSDILPHFFFCKAEGAKVLSPAVRDQLVPSLRYFPGHVRIPLHGEAVEYACGWDAVSMRHVP